MVTSMTKMTRVLEGLERILFPKHEVRGTHSDKGGSDVEEELFLFGLRGADMVLLHLQTKCQVRSSFGPLLCISSSTVDNSFHQTLESADRLWPQQTGMGPRLSVNT